MCLTQSLCVCVCVCATPVGNQVKHSIVDYMRFIYDFPRCHYEMFPLDFVSFYCHFYSTCYCCGLFRIASPSAPPSSPLFHLTILQHFCLNFAVLKLFNVQLSFFLANWQHLIAQKNIVNKKSRKRKRKIRKYCQLL